MDVNEQNIVTIRAKPMFTLKVPPDSYLLQKSYLVTNPLWVYRHKGFDYFRIVLNNNNLIMDKTSHTTNYTLLPEL